ncbi:MAG: hypothetical protein CMJ46_01085 [Planctomyces sp.]|nr:hypothetical protein [Planctomyces sp.]
MVWNTIAEKILQLNDLDRQCQAFGAAKHRYAFRPVLSTDHLKEFERDHAFQIPDELRKVYLELGNGGVGPHYGLLPLDQWQLFQPAIPYHGADHHRQRYLEEHPDADPANPYFEADFDEITGLVGVIHEGCGHMTCMVTAGEKVGKIVYCSCDGHLSDADANLADIYLDWLHTEIGLFKEAARTVENYRTASDSPGGYESTVVKRDRERRIRSLLNMPGTDASAPYEYPEETDFLGWNDPPLPRWWEFWK